MELSCPSCQQKIEVDLEGTTDAGPLLGSTIGEIDCPSCGSVPLPLDGDATLSYMQEHVPPETRQVGHFKLIRLLGAGAFGAVWLAEDETLGRKVALKLQLSPEQDVDSLLHEAHTAAGLDHPNIVSIYEVGRDAGRIFVASQYLDGLTLQNLLSQGKPPVRRACELAATVARALHYAHQRGVIHRDIKPSNIILDASGQPCIADFGLAKKLSASQTISFEGQVLGTARYMSPEQAAGRTQQTDHRADLYALGVCLFQMLTGHLPFRGNVQAVLHQKMFEDAPSPRSLAPTLPRDLETICLKCLERDPARRYESTQELAEELDRYLKGEPIKARPITSAERLWRWCQRRPTVSSLVVGLFLSLSIGLAGVTYYWQQAERSDEFTRKALYRSQMNLAPEYLARADVVALRQTLDRFRSDDRHRQLRGFEWHYYDNASRKFAQTMDQGVPVEEVAVTADGSLAASIGMDRDIRIWDTRTGELIRTLQHPAARCLTLTLLPGTNRLAAGSTDGVVRIWNPLDGERALAQFKHGPQVHFLQVSKDGMQLLTAGRSGAIRLWNSGTLERITELPTGQGETTDVQFSIDRSLIVAAKSDGQIRVIDVSIGTPTQTFGPISGIEVLALSSDAQRLAIGTYSGDLIVIDRETGQELSRTPAGMGLIGDIEFLDDTLLAVTGITGSLLLFDLESRTEISRTSTHELNAGVLARSQQESTLVVGSGDGSLKVMNVDALLKPRVFWHAAAVRDVAFLPGATSVIATDGDGGVRRWVLQDGESTSVADSQHAQDAVEKLTAAAVRPDGSLAALSGRHGGIQLRDAKTGALLQSIPSDEGQIVRLQFSPDGQRLLAVSDEGRVTCWLIFAAARPELQCDLSSSDSRFVEAIFTPDSRRLLVARRDGRLTFWNAAENESEERILRVGSPPSALAFCRDGSTLVVGTVNGELFIIDPETGQILSQQKAHSGRVNALAAFPDGRSFVSGGRDRALKLWDVESGERLTTLYGHGRQVFSIAISDDGQTIASGSLAGDVRIWRGN